MRVYTNLFEKYLLFKEDVFIFIYTCICAFLIIIHCVLYLAGYLTWYLTKQESIRKKLLAVILVVLVLIIFENYFKNNTQLPVPMPDPNPGAGGKNVFENPFHQYYFWGDQTRTCMEYMGSSRDMHPETGRIIGRYVASDQLPNWVDAIIRTNFNGQVHFYFSVKPGWIDPYLAHQYLGEHHVINYSLPDGTGRTMTDVMSAHGRFSETRVEEALESLKNKRIWIKDQRLISGFDARVANGFRPV